jgi:hypothetical protein
MQLCIPRDCLEVNKTLARLVEDRLLQQNNNNDAQRERKSNIPLENVLKISVSNDSDIKIGKKSWDRNSKRLQRVFTQRS